MQGEASQGVGPSRHPLKILGLPVISNFGVAGPSSMDADVGRNCAIEIVTQAHP